MELNHQIRLCRPFPFLFGFRANSHNADMVRKMNQGVTTGPGSHQFTSGSTRRDPRRSRFIKSLPRKNR